IRRLHGRCCSHETRFARRHLPALPARPSRRGSVGRRDRRATELRVRRSGESTARPEGHHGDPDRGRTVGMIEIGTAPPDFTLLTDEGKSLTLSEQVGKHVVLYFFPKADTPG